jgi:hypothetical protein
MQMWATYMHGPSACSGSRGRCSYIRCRGAFYFTRTAGGIAEGIARSFPAFKPSASPSSVLLIRHGWNVWLANCCFASVQCDIALNLDTVPIRQGQEGYNLSSITSLNGHLNFMQIAGTVHCPGLTNCLVSASSRYRWESDLWQREMRASVPERCLARRSG